MNKKNNEEILEVYLQVQTTQLAKMSIDPKFVELMADVLEIFFIIYRLYLKQKNRTPSIKKKTHPHSILQVPKVKADVLRIFLLNTAAIHHLDPC